MDQMFGFEIVTTCRCLGVEKEEKTFYRKNPEQREDTHYYYKAQTRRKILSDSRKTIKGKEGQSRSHDGGTCFKRRNEGVDLQVTDPEDRRRTGGDWGSDDTPRDR